jgi:plastocyanin
MTPKEFAVKEGQNESTKEIMKSSSFRRITAVLTIAVALGLSLSAGSAATVMVTVGNGDDSFSPSSVTIHPGDTVQWTWNENGHTCTSGSSCAPNGLWDSGLRGNGATFSYTFNTAGTFPYFCTPHCDMGMVGIITVTNATSTPTPTPAVTTNPATFVTSTSATLNGSVNPRGTTTTVSFQYGLTTSYGSTTAMQTQTGTTARAITANISGLSTNTTYHFRIVAHNVGGTSFGADRTFTTLTPTGPPVVLTSPATLIASFSAALNGLVDPHGLTTTVHFQYGTTTSYGLTTAPQSRSGNTYLNVTANVSSLSANTIYHYRIVASNSSGTRMGSDRTFTTLSATGAPVVTTGSATSVTSSSATLNGSLDPHGLTTTVSFQWGTTTSYGHTTAMQSQTGNTYRNIAANISSLATHTTYHFRIVATNSAGTRMGSDRIFTTP